jgi:hypothetical protein
MVLLYRERSYENEDYIPMRRQVLLPGRQNKRQTSRNRRRRQSLCLKNGRVGNSQEQNPEPGNLDSLSRNNTI